jgi:hypothetical protein
MGLIPYFWDSNKDKLLINSRNNNIINLVNKINKLIQMRQCIMILQKNLILNLLVKIRECKHYDKKLIFSENKKQMRLELKILDYNQVI